MFENENIKSQPAIKITVGIITGELAPLRGIPRCICLWSRGFGQTSPAEKGNNRIMEPKSCCYYG